MASRLKLQTFISGSRVTRNKKLRLGFLHLPLRQKACSLWSLTSQRIEIIFSTLGPILKENLVYA